MNIGHKIDLWRKENQMHTVWLFLHTQNSSEDKDSEQLKKKKVFQAVKLMDLMQMLNKGYGEATRRRPGG